MKSSRAGLVDVEVRKTGMPAASAETPCSASLPAVSLRILAIIPTLPWRLSLPVSASAAKLSSAPTFVSHEGERRMRKQLWILPVLCLSTLQSLAADDKTDKDKLQGTWVVSSVAFMGKTKSFEKVEECTYTFKGDKITIHDPSRKKDKDAEI